MLLRMFEKSMRSFQSQLDFSVSGGTRCSGEKLPYKGKNNLIGSHDLYIFFTCKGAKSCKRSGCRCVVNIGSKLKVCPTHTDKLTKVQCNVRLHVYFNSKTGDFVQILKGTYLCSYAL